MDKIIVNGIEYVPAKTNHGNRYVVVVDRGWIYAGDLTEENGRIILDNAIWIFKWESIGFDGVLNDPGSKLATLKSVGHQINIPADAEVFRVHVVDNWGDGCCR